jgi:hypothetical protein
MISFIQHNSNDPYELQKGPPAEYMNWLKWSDGIWDSADEKPIQDRAIDQRELKYDLQLSILFFNIVPLRFLIPNKFLVIKVPKNIWISIKYVLNTLDKKFHPYIKTKRILRLLQIIEFEPFDGWLSLNRMIYASTEAKEY